MMNCSGKKVIANEVWYAVLYSVKKQDATDLNHSIRFLPMTDICVEKDKLWNIPAYFS